MALNVVGAVCQFVDAGDHLECVGGTAADLTIVPQSVVVGPMLVPSSGPPGRTSFNVTYENFAEPAVDATRYGELQGFINSYIEDFASCLGPMRDTSDPANAITVNTKINFASLTQSYLLNVNYGPPPVGGNSTGLGTRWRITMTKYNSTGVFVKDIPLGYNDINTFPSSGNDFNLDLISMSRQLQFGNQINPLVNTPSGNFVCPSTCEFRWVFTLPSGSMAVAPTMTIPFCAIDSVQSTFFIAQNTAFYVNASPAWTIGDAPGGDIGSFILAQAGPLNASAFPQADNIQQAAPQLWDCTGVALPAPVTPMPNLGGLSNGTSPLILSSQWRFMRVYPDWAPYKAAVDAALTASTPDIQMTINTDFNRLTGVFYSYANSYLVPAPPPALYCFKAVLIHELHHGLGFIEGVAIDVGGSKYSIALWNHYLFEQGAQPNNTTDFMTFPRATPQTAPNTTRQLSNGITAAPIQGTSSSHLFLAGSSFNGIMEPSLSQGNVIPNGTSPNGGPSANDKFGLLCGCVADCSLSVCVHEDTVLATDSGDKAIKDIRAGDLVRGVHGEWVAVKRNVRIPSWENFVVLPAGVISEGVPKQELLIRPGHPMLIDGREVFCEELVGQSRIGTGPVELRSNNKSRISVYTLITENRNFVNMQGVLVGTWSEDAWENFRANDFAARTFAMEQ